MKKLLIFAVLSILIALLPFVGNQAVKNTIEERLSTLTQNGLKTQLQKEEKSYLDTTLHYVITVEDEEKFLSYLQSFSTKELPPYTKSLLDGVVFAADISYSNIPFSEKISIELYPLKLSDTTMEDLKKDDPNVYAFISNLLQKRALLYHIDYDVVNGEFEGYMRDLDEKLTTKEDMNLSIVLNGVQATGRGTLLAPDFLQTKVKHMMFTLSDAKNAFRIDIEDMLTTNSFESRSTYTISSKAQSAHFFVHSSHTDPVTSKLTVEEMRLQLKNFMFEGSSNTQGEDAELHVKTTLDELRFAQNAQSFVFEGLRYDSSLRGVEKESFIKLQQTIEKNSQVQDISTADQQAVEEAIEKIFAHGLEFDITDLSLEKLSTPEVKDIEGFALTMRAKMKPDPDLVKHSNQNPSALIENLSLQSDIRFSQPFYALINRIYPIDIMVADYKKEQNGEILFHIELQNGTVTVNDKRIQ